MPETKNFPVIASYISDEFTTRKNARTGLEEQWREIDRQLAMEPTLVHKMSGNKPDTRKAWMPEIELPLQSQTLEVLTADARRMQKPSTGPWFGANAEVTDEYLEKHDLEAIISGDLNDVPSLVDQDTVNKLVIGAVSHWERQYDFWGNIDLINAEAFKYGTGVGRGRVVTKRVFLNTAKGVVKQNQKIPVLFPISIKNTYLDNSSHFLMNEGQMIGPLTLFFKKQKVEDLKKASRFGGKAQGWLPITRIEGDKKGEVELIEMEGDLIIPKPGKGVISIPNAIITVARGVYSNKAVQKVVRFRLRDKPYSSFIEFPYHRESLSDHYSTSPLLKGRPLQIAAVEALTRALIAAQLNALPPLSYDADDMNFAQNGGPNIYPGALWGSTSDIVVHEIGSPQELMVMYGSLLQQYSDVTGINAPRLGAQTVSHTTAFAKDAELQRGVSRTVDYVASTNDGPLTQWLYNCYDLGRDVMNKTVLYIDDYGGFVEIGKSHLPKRVMFEAFGAGAIAEEQAVQNAKLVSLQTILSMDQIRAQYEQMGIQPSINFEVVTREILKGGGWKDVDVITGTEAIPEGSDGEPPLEDDLGSTTTAPGAAIQALSEIAQ